MNKKHLFSLLLVVFLLAGVLAACVQEEAAVEATTPTAPAAVEEATPAEPAEAPAQQVAVEPPAIEQPIALLNTIVDRPWLLVGYGDAANPTVVQEGTVITVVFSSDGEVSGSAGCNNFFGSYTADDQGNLTIDGPLGSTMMACPEGMDQEAAYLAALQSVSAYNVNEQGRLELTYSTGQTFDEKLVYTSAETPLVGTTWSLVSMGDPAEPVTIVPGTAITANFASDDPNGLTGTVAGSATCNNYNTSYTIDGDAIAFGPIITTMMICPLAPEQEPLFLDAMNSAETFEIVGSQLNITYDGGVLVFSSLNLPLENVLWTALSIGGMPVPMDASMTALFDPSDEEAGTGIVSGNSGCNVYNAGYTIVGDALTIAPGVSSLRACADPAIDEAEQAFNRSLAAAESFDILGEQMILRSPEGDIFFVADREPLEGTLWTLISLGSVEEQRAPFEGSAFTAIFDRVAGVPSGIMSGTTGCNDYNATYTANLTEIKVNLPSKTNNEGCADGIIEEEQAFFLGLNAATTYRILGNVLQIPYGEPGSQLMLTFEGSPIPVPSEALDLTPLAGTFWYLSAFGGQTILPGTEITAQFDINADGVTGTISGSTGCNGYNGPIAENFVIGPLATTQRACDSAVTAQEAQYLSWLQSAQGYSRVGDQLLVPTASGVLTFNSAPILDQAHLLRNVTWYLVSYETLLPIAGANPTAFFDANGATVRGTTGCNDYTGAYRAGQGNTLAISDIASTLAACSTDALTQQQDTFRRLMISAVSYAVNGSSLQIRTVDGGTMNFTSVPPAAPVPPTAIITGPTEGQVGQPLIFDATRSQAGSSPIVRYQWDMSDGNRLSGNAIEYVFTVPGSYVLTLTAVDQAGRTGTASQTITIAAVPDTPPTAAITGPGLVEVGEQVTLSAAGSAPGTNPIASYSWHSGDGNDTGPISSDTFTTIYTVPGVYYPTVTVSDANGLSASATMEIRVNASLGGTTWALTTAAPGTSITVVFGNGTLSGFAGCNNYNATYTSTMMAGPTNNISVGPITSTGALCPEEIMVQETAYLANLQTASSYTIDGSTLTLTTAEGTLVYVAVQAVPLPIPATP